MIVLAVEPVGLVMVSSALSLGTITVPLTAVVGVALVMLAVAAQTVGSRHRATAGRWWLRLEAFGSLVVGSSLVMAVSIRLALRVEPWYDARTVLPMLGMILGNAVSAVGPGRPRVCPPF